MTSTAAYSVLPRAGRRLGQLVLPLLHRFLFLLGPLELNWS